MSRKIIIGLMMIMTIASALYAQEFKLVQERYDSLNLREVRVMMLDTNGQYINHGPFITWNEKGTRLSEGEYNHGELNGIVTKYRDDLTRESETIYYFGEKISEDKYDDKGITKLSQKDTLNILTRIDEVTLRDGQFVRKEGYDSKIKIFVNHGPATVWYKKDGAIKEIGNFFKGKPHGLMTHWGPLGKKKYEGTYNLGKENGVWVYWDDSGALASLIIYKDGKIVREIKP